MDLVSHTIFQFHVSKFYLECMILVEMGSCKQINFNTWPFLRKLYHHKLSCNCTKHLIYGYSHVDLILSALLTQTTIHSHHNLIHFAWDITSICCYWPIISSNFFIVPTIPIATNCAPHFTMISHMSCKTFHSWNVIHRIWE